MSTSPAPRRSGRERKAATQFISAGKRKRDSDSEEEEPDLGSEDDVESPPASPVPTPKKKARTSKATTAKGTTSTKKPRASAPRKQKKTDAFDAGRAAKDTGIASDNPLYNATLNPAAALQSTAEDFLESLTESPGAALAELINCILRACGCNDKLDADEVLDFDGVVDALDNFTEGLKKDNSPVYPLTSKLPIFKKFRKSLSELIERIITSAAELGSLYTTELMETLQAWVVAMSSSQIRSFRHTATVVALEVETALCDVAAAVEKEAEVVARQKEGEKKRKAKGAAGKAKDKELDQKADEIRERREKLTEFLKEFVDGVFVHRYRDTDPVIRAECVHALGQWFKKHPGHFLDSAYLRYVGWVLFDADLKVRIDAIKALGGVYEYGGGESDETNPYIASLSHFTERFKPRLIEMATRDSDASVRTATIGVVGAIDAHSLLEDEERERMCLLVYDEDKKVRKAVGSFVEGVWEEAVKERLVGRKATEKEKSLVGVKAFAVLLVEWGKGLDKLSGEESDHEDGMDIDETGEGSSRANRVKETVSILAIGQKTRIDFVIEALWDTIESVSDWEGLLAMLLLDHSPPEEATGNSKRAKGKNTGAVDEAWRLEEVEESILLEVLAASLRQTKLTAKKGDEDAVASDITRALIKGLPRLFVKYQTDQGRISDVLSIIPCMNVDLYLEMRMLQAYGELWDDVTKQFLSHSSLLVLNHAVATIDHLLNASSLANTNSKKILELEDELSTTLRDAVGGQDEIEVASFTDDETLKLTAICARINTLTDKREMCTWLEDDDDGKQSSAWDIVSALLERSALGYKAEDSMAIHALNILVMHIMWKSVLEIDITGEPSPVEQKIRDSLNEQKNSLLEKVTEYAVGTSNTTATIKRHAFIQLMTLQSLMTPQSVGDEEAEAVLPLALDDQAQFRCAGFLQAEIERYAESVDVGQDEKSDDDSEGEGADSDTEKSTKKKKKKPRKKPTVNTAKPKAEVDNSDPSTSRARLEEDYVFSEFTSAFLRAIQNGVINVRHGASSLMNFGRLDSVFDVHCKTIIDLLRLQGMYHNEGEEVVSVVTESLQNAFTLVMDGLVSDETHSVALAKALTSTFVMKGAHLAVVKRLDSKYVVEVHTTLLTWIGKQIATLDKKDNKKARNTAITFFRVMRPLLVPGLPSKDATKIKTHMDQVFNQAKIEISATSKAWEPQRAYEKRLAALQQTKAAKGKANGKGPKSKAMITDDEEEEVGDAGATTEEERPTTPKPKPKPKPKPRPLRATRANPKEPPPASEPEIPAEEQEGEAEEAPNVTPKAKTKPSTTYRKKSSPTRSATRSPSAAGSPTKSATRSPTRSLARSQTLSSPPRSRTDTPSKLAATEEDVEMAPPSSRKRGREDGDEEEDLGVEESDGLRAPSQGIIVKRKRVRH